MLSFSTWTPLYASPNCANPFPDLDTRIVAYRNIDTFEPVTVSTNDLLMQGQSLLTYNSNLLSQTSPKRLGRSAEHAMALVADGTVRLDVTSEFELADTEAAIANLAGGSSRGKSIVRVA